MAPHPVVDPFDDPRFHRRALRVVALVTVQVFPLVVLAIVYPSIAVELHRATIGGVTVATLMVTAAVLGPLLAQTVSAPIYRGIDGVDRRDRGAVSRAALRHLPAALLIGVPVAAAVAVAVAHAVAWPTVAVLAFVLVVELHVLLASLLVAAYATGSQMSLLVAWSVYAVALRTFPTVVWLPAAAAAASQLPILVLRAARAARSDRTGGPSFVALLGAVVRGVADAVPLWSIPVAIFAAAPGRFDAGPVFAGMLPAIIAYHVYFQTTAEPMWRRIDRIRRDMGVRTYAEIEGGLRELRFRSRIGVSRVVALELLLAVLTVLVMGAVQWNGIALFLGVLTVSSLAVVVLAQVYTLSMLHDSPPVLAAAAVIAGAIVVALSMQVDVTHLLAVLGTLFVVLAGALAVLNDRAWRMPEHALFWKSALAQ